MCFSLPSLGLIELRIPDGCIKVLCGIQVEVLGAEVLFSKLVGAVVLVGDGDEFDLSAVKLWS